LTQYTNETLQKTSQVQGDYREDQKKQARTSKKNNKSKH